MQIFANHLGTANYQQRVQLMNDALDDALRYLHRLYCFDCFVLIVLFFDFLKNCFDCLNRGGEIAILDGTNTTRDRRDIIRNRVAQVGIYYMCIHFYCMYSISVIVYIYLILYVYMYMYHIHLQYKYKT